VTPHRSSTSTTLGWTGSLGATHVINGEKEDVRKRITDITGPGLVGATTSAPRALL
jgi:hypothetical protein